MMHVRFSVGDMTHVRGGLLPFHGAVLGPAAACAAELPAAPLDAGGGGTVVPARTALPRRPAATCAIGGSRSLRCGRACCRMYSRSSGLARSRSYSRTMVELARNASMSKHQKCSWESLRMRVSATYACPSAKNSLLSRMCTSPSNVQPCTRCTVTAYEGSTGN